MSFKTFVLGHPRDTILKELEEFGKELKEKSNPALYNGNEGKAKHYRQNLEATRIAYGKIKNGLNARKAIKELWFYVKDDRLKILLEKTGR